MENRNLKIEYWKNGRYIIVDEDSGEIVDDAQGYGYKDKQRAFKAMWWKYNKGKEKKDNEKKLFNDWIKIETNKEILNKINNVIVINFKEISRNETTILEIIKEFEKEYSIELPKFVKNKLC